MCLLFNATDIDYGMHTSSYICIKGNQETYLLYIQKNEFTNNAEFQIVASMASMLGELERVNRGSKHNIKDKMS